MTNKNNKLDFLNNAKARLAVVAGLVVVVLIALIVVFHSIYKQRGDISEANISQVPDTKSLPGVGDASDQYVKTQNDQNIKEAQEAREAGKSSVPTLTRPGVEGNLGAFNPENIGKNNSDQNADLLARQRCNWMKPDPNACKADALELARGSGVKAMELRCKGCSCLAIKSAGYTAADLKNAGYTAEELHDCGYSLKDLVVAGFSANDLKAAGFSAKQLKAAGFTAGQLRDSGFAAADLLQAGFSPSDLRKAGFADKVKPTEVIAKDGVCSVEALKRARSMGVSAVAIKNKGCSAAELKVAGYTAAELKAAGFSAKDLKNAGFSPKDLKDAGFSAQDLKAAGFSAGDLKNAGFSAKDLKGAGFSAAGLKAAGFSAAALNAAGFNAKALKDAGFLAGQLRAAGFSASDLTKASFSPKELRTAGFSAKDLKDAGISVSALKKAGFTDGALLRAGFSPADIGVGSASGQCSVIAIKQARMTGASLQAMENKGCSLMQLKKAGLSAADLKKMGFNAQQLKSAGFSPAELRKLGFSSNSSAVDADGGQSSAMPETDEERRLRQLQAERLAKMTPEQREMFLQNLQGQMSSQAQQLIGGWTGAPATQAFKESPKTQAELSAGQAGADGAAAAAGPIVKAGTVMFAVLETGVNSDENSPIMAKIVAGKLKGSTLLGSFQRVDKKLLLTFNLLNMPSQAASVQVNLVAIDQHTAHTAVSGQVNNHYLLRYGTMFGASFLSGFSKALMASRVTAGAASPLEKLFSSPQPFSTKQAALIGAGNIGTTVSQNMGDIVNMPPTIKIASGTGIGLLFMADLTLPTDKDEAPVNTAPSGKAESK